nr:J domain-containing protein [Myxococcus sp. AM011]
MSTVQFVLFFSDKQVREQLFAHVDGTRGLLLVTGVRHGPAMRSPEAREPFATLEFLHGRVLTQVLVADEGTADGMWRDPLGDLGDRLYPESRDDAYAVTSGYLLLEDGRPRTVVRKHGLPANDLWFLEDALSQLTSRVPPPDPARKPGTKRPERAPRSPRRPASTGAPVDSDASGPPPDEGGWRQRAGSAGSRRVRPERTSASESSKPWDDASGHDPREAHATDSEATPPRGTRAPPPREPARKDAWAVLGLARDMTLDEARKAFRALIAGYHPDKVSHLAPEFQELAERRTREILAAWEEVEVELKSDR